MQRQDRESGVLPHGSVSLEVRFGPARIRSRGGPSPIAPRPGLDLAVRQGGRPWPRRDHGKLAPGEGGTKGPSTPPFPLRPRPANPGPRKRNSTARFRLEMAVVVGRQAARLTLHVCPRINGRHDPIRGRRVDAKAATSPTADGRERETGRWARGNGVCATINAAAPCFPAPPIGPVDWLGKTAGRRIGPSRLKSPAARGCNNGGRLIRTSNGTPDSLGGEAREGSRQGRIP